MAKILVIDDDELICSMLAQSIEHAGHDPLCASTLAEGMALARREEFDVALLDVRLPDGDGLKYIAALRETPSRPEVIIITGEGDPDGAELAIKSGAWDYIEKPASVARMTLPMIRAVERRAQLRAMRAPQPLMRDKIIGRSPQISHCLALLAEAATSDQSVLVSGPTGSGKEVFALAVHENSRRAEGPFVAVDCAALPPSLAESVLFGHRRGAFTSAERDSEGLITQADGGTLFLDEIGELPLDVQKSFLRVLQEKTFRPVGGHKERFSDFRLVAATNRDLDDMVRRGQFREDLLYRVRSFAIPLPPLKDREGDVKELAIHYIGEACERRGVAAKGYVPEFMETLQDYDWPGNVRELANAIERAVAAARFETTLFPLHLPSEIRIRLAKASMRKKPEAAPAQDPPGAAAGAATTGAASDLFPVSPLSAAPVAEGEPQPLGDWKTYKEAALGDYERRYFQSLLEMTGGDVRKAAGVSGLTRARVYGIIKKHKLRH